MRQFRAIAIERIGFEAETPRHHVSVVTVFDAGIIGHVDRFGDRAGHERLGRRHHLDVAFPRQIALADFAAWVCTVEDRIVVVGQVRCALKGHRSAGMEVCSLDFGLRKPDGAQQVKVGVEHRSGIKTEGLGAELFAKGPLVESEANIECGWQTCLDRFDLGVAKAFATQRLVIDTGGIFQRAAAHRIINDLDNLIGSIAEGFQSRWHGAVDDFEVSAACELFELHEGEVWLDPGGIAVHDQTDGAGRRNHRGLGVAIAVLLAEFNRCIPCFFSGFDQTLIGAVRVIERYGRGAQFFIPGGETFRRAAVVAHNTQHFIGVFFVACERTQLARHFSRGRIGDAGQNSRERAAERTALVRVVAEPHRHQQTADVCVTKAECAEIVAASRDGFRRELRHQHADLKRDRPETHRVLVSRQIKAAIGLHEGQQVQGCEVTSRVVEEHILRARVRATDLAAVRAGVPVVDGVVVLNARISAGPSGVADLFPKTFCLNRLVNRTVAATDQIPLAVFFHRRQEFIFDADRIVGVLTRDRQVSV